MTTKKKAQKTSKRAKKAGVKDLEPKSSPKGGFMFSQERAGGTPLESPAQKVQYKY